MRKFRKTFAYALVAAVAVAVTTTNALAACANVRGIWHWFLMQSDTPGIDTVNANVMKGDNSGPVNIKVFRHNSSPSGATALAIRCRVNIAANGSFTEAPCTAYGVEDGDGGPVKISGQITFAANPTCLITGGTINVSEGEDGPVTLLGGYVNPTQKHGAGIARQGPGSVFLFNMVKQ